MTEKAVVRLIKKSNQLVEAKYKFDIWETRVFAKMISLIKLDDADFKDYRIYIKDIIDEFALSDQNSSYERIKEGAINLMSKTVKILRDTDEGETEFHTNIISGVEHLKNDGLYIDISFHPKMKPFLLQLKDRFTTYDVRNILLLPSSYSIRLYELLKQYEKIGQRKFDIYELKETVGAIESIIKRKKTEIIDHYPLYGNFRQRVLLKAQKDLLKYTDIKFTFEPIKRGRKVTEIIFYISKNHPTRTPIIIKKETEEKPIIYNVFAQIENKIKDWNTKPTEETINKLLENGAREENIREAVKYTQNRIDSKKPIDNEVAYFVKMVQEAKKQGNLFDPIEHKKGKEEDRQKAEEKRQNKIETLELKAQKLRTKISREQNKIVAEIKEKHPKKVKEIYEKMKLETFSGYDPRKTEKENLQHRAVNAYITRKISKAFPKSMIEIQKLEIEHKALKNKINRL